MSSIRGLSPARSQGEMASPRPRRTRRSRSMCSTTSNTSLRLTAIMHDSFRMSPLPDRLSVLNDDTDIQIPGRQSWWKRLGNNSRDVSEIMVEKENVATIKVTNVAEELDVEILSQEKGNMSVDLPESSDGESIHSIVIPQRKLFKNPDHHPQKKLKASINRKETLVKMQKSYFDQTNIDKDINVMPKKLFNQAPKARTKPVFTKALINISANKTINKSTEKTTHEVQGQVRNLFGNQPTTKRKNVYAEFLVSDSEDEIPEIQPRVFGFQKKTNQHKQQRRSGSQSSVHTPALNMTDEEIEDWQHLPSSTMVEHQLEESGVAKDMDSYINHSNNTAETTLSKIKQPESEKSENKSHSANKSKNRSNIKDYSNKFPGETSKKNSSILDPEMPMDKTLATNNMNVDFNEEQTLTEAIQHEDENITLTYENDEDEIYDTNANAKEANDNLDLKRNEKSLPKSDLTMEITPKHITNVGKDSSTNISQDNNMQENILMNVKEQTDKVGEANRSKAISDEVNMISTPRHDEHISNVIDDKIQELEGQGSEVQKESRNSTELQQEGNENSILATKSILNKLENSEINKKKQDEIETKQMKEVRQINTNKDIEENQIDVHKIVERNKIESEIQNDIGQNVQYYEKPNNITKNEKSIQEMSENVVSHCNNQLDNIEQSENYNDDTTGKRKQELLESPEAVLHNRSNAGESFTTHGRHTSMSKSKTMIKDLNIRPSLAPARESTGLSDGAINSSTEGSGWDSHRTTRKTLRQTFGKDFTPRKSLRTLVMERSAKRKTINNQPEKTAIKSDYNFNEANNKSKDSSTIHSSFNKVSDKSNAIEIERQSKDKSLQQTSYNEDLNKSKRQTYFGDITNKRPMANSTELPGFESYQEHLDDSEQESNHNEEAIQDIEKNKKVPTGQEPKPIQIELELDQILEQQEEVKLDEELEQHADIESGQQPEKNEEIRIDESIEQNEENESDQESEEHEEIDSDKESEQNEIETSQSSEKNEDESDQELEETQVESEEDLYEEHEENVSQHDTEQNDTRGTNQASEQMNEENESDHENEEIESDHGPDYVQEVQSDQDEDDKFESEPEQNNTDQEIDSMDVDDTENSHHQVNQMRQTTLEMYLQKVKQENAERRRKVQEKVMSSLKVQREPFNLFKMPEIPKQKRTTKTVKKISKNTRVKPSLFSNELPPEFFEDLNYKPPKRFQGKNAPWITKRLYKFLEDKLQPKYDYRSRVRAEKLVEKLYLFSKDVRKCERAAPPQAIADLKGEMARLGVVTSHYEFYQFFHEYMPREIRIRVNPDILNKIPKPRNVFGNILEE